ncbi:MAG: hypothetical protein R3A51_14070 [Nannocystaceae bacterium]
MHPRDLLPPVFDDYARAFGVLEFLVFDDADGDEDAALTAITALIPEIDRVKLRELGARRIDDRAFFGDWYDADADALLRRGSYRTKDKRQLVDPRLTDLDDVEIKSGGFSNPSCGGGGQFAYAFSWTPYGLRARPSEVQRMFSEIRDFILPPGLRHEIRDWSSPRLPEAARYFEAGMEWWGVFLFTIHVPTLSRLTVIAGSTTD